jgi:peptide/nickel transport system permease protein
VSRVSYVIRRLLQLIPVALGVTAVTFFMVHMIPGDPARTMLGPRATDEAVAALHEQWGLDQSLPRQYADFMTGLAHGDLGDSILYRVPTRELIFDRLPATLWLIGFAVVLAVVIAVPLAVLAATKKNSVRDQAIRAVPLFGLGMPPFWIGIMLILVFSLNAGRLFPVGGYGHGLGGHLHSMVLPGLTVALFITPILIRSLRASLLTVLESDYVTTARAKGISERRVLMRHAVRNAVISTVTVLGVNVAFLVGTTVVVERVFALPGVGGLMIDSILQRDFPVVQGVALTFAVLVVVVYLLTDVVHSLLDLRVRLGA